MARQRHAPTQNFAMPQPNRPGGLGSGRAREAYEGGDSGNLDRAKTLTWCAQKPRPRGWSPRRATWAQRRCVSSFLLSRGSAIQRGGLRMGEHSDLGAWHTACDRPSPLAARCAAGAPVPLACCAVVSWALRQPACCRLRLINSRHNPASPSVLNLHSRPPLQLQIPR